MAENSWNRYDMKKLECGPMPNQMAALPNAEFHRLTTLWRYRNECIIIIGGALCSTPQSLADAHY